MIWLRRRAGVLVIGLMAASCFSEASCAGEVETARGAVVLTVAGAIGNWNRPAFDADRDTFFKYHEITFDRAMQFDREMLAALPQGEVEANPPQLHRTGKFTGPRLDAVLEAVGARDAKSVRLMALDGFSVEIEAPELRSKDWIVATAIDGKPLAVGGQGPAWVLFSPKEPARVGEDEEQRWPWAVFFVEVK